MLDHRILQLAADQYGIISARQLRGLFDISQPSIARARRQGLIVEMASQVFRIASSPDSFEARCFALQLHARDEGYLSGWTAARLHGLRAMPVEPIHYTVSDARRRDHPAWADVHRTSWFSESDRLRRPDGLVVATGLRTLFGLAASYNQFRFERAAEDAWHRGLVSPTQAAAYLDAHRCRGKDGVSTMERWLETALRRDRPTHSNLERRLVEALRHRGVPAPTLQFALTLRHGEVIHLDLAWPDVRLAVEPGAAWWHGGDLAQRRDQARDRACAELGWMIIRFDESMRSDLPDAARQVARIHRRRRQDHENSVGNDFRARAPHQNSAPSAAPPEFW